MSKSFLSEIENDHAVPGGEVLLKLAEVFGTTTDYILRGSGVSTAPVDTSVSIPGELDSLAKELSLSYPATVALVNARRSVVANRGEGTPWSKQDWKNLYDRLRDYLK